MTTSVFKRFFMFPTYILNSCRTVFIISRLKNTSCDECTMRVLNVAEKNDVAKNLSACLAQGHIKKRESLSKFNKIYEFECEVFGRNSQMIMTSVSGHLLNYDFPEEYRSWIKTNPISLFQAPLVKYCPKENKNIKAALEKEIMFCNNLIIWTDCDREGENIGFEIIEVCKEKKPSINVYRARFSEITKESVKRAIRNLVEPNKFINSAVEVRRELDLRIGAVFTRFQTLHFSRAFPSALKNHLISYGSCQFPTLGFVVDRFKAIVEFIPENFWQLNVKHEINGMTVDFKWKRERLFNQLTCEALYAKCSECNIAVVEDVISKPKTKWRPKPLDTVELERAISKNFGITAKETMRIAEKLYSQGLISYPRTETTIFLDVNFRNFVECQTKDPRWGEFAQRVLRDGPNPFQGNKTDNAHPPIHPIKYSDELSGNEKKIYEFIVRRFLACLSKHAEGLETVVCLDVAGEKFEAKGLMITAKNYLEVYPYDRWNAKEIHLYEKGDNFEPKIEMAEGKTTPPELLTEADLIALMEKHGIGTDATHAEHIENIKSRRYVGLKSDKYFVPRTLGMGLVEGYNSLGYAMAKPELRAELEKDLQRICDNQISGEEVLFRYINNSKEMYENIVAQVNDLIGKLRSYIQVESGSEVNKDNFEIGAKCPICNSNLVLREMAKNSKKYISCSGFPSCRYVRWFPSFVKNVAVTKDICPSCGPNTYFLKFKFEQNNYLPSVYVGCISCDKKLHECLNCRERIAPRESRTSSSSTSDSTDFTNSSKRINYYNAEESPNCYCGLPCKSSFVTKEGPNKGEKFYACNKVKDNCKFFKWANPNFVQKKSWRSGKK